MFQHVSVIVIPQVWRWILKVTGPDVRKCAGWVKFTAVRRLWRMQPVRLSRANRSQWNVSVKKKVKEPDRGEGVLLSGSCSQSRTFLWHRQDGKKFLTSVSPHKLWQKWIYFGFSAFGLLATFCLWDLPHLKFGCFFFFSKDRFQKQKSDTGDKSVGFQSSA